MKIILPIFISASLLTAGMLYDNMPLLKIDNSDSDQCRDIGNILPSNFDYKSVYCKQVNKDGSHIYNISSINWNYTKIGLGIDFNGKFEEPKSIIFIIHGGPNGQSFSSFVNSEWRRPATPPLFYDVVQECNAAVVTIGYAGSRGRSFYPKSDWIYAIQEINFILDSINKKYKDKVVIVADSLGARIAINLNKNNNKMYWIVPMLDSPLEQEKYFSNNFKINESVPVYLDEEREGELHLIPSPHFFNRFFASDEEKNQNIVQLYDKKPNGRNLKKIIFGENDIKTMPWRFYDDFSDRNVNYEIIDNLGHDYFSEDNFIDIKASLKEVKDISCQDIEK